MPRRGLNYESHPADSEPPPPLTLDIPTITDYKTFGTYSTSRGRGGAYSGKVISNLIVLDSLCTYGEP